MGKNVPQPLFISLLNIGVIFFSRWVRISSNILLEYNYKTMYVYKENLGQLRLGSDFFFKNRNPVETLFIHIILFSGVIFFFICHPCKIWML